MTIRTLLVPVDFTKTSKKAVDYALQLAKKWDAKIIFIHGYSLVLPYESSMDSTMMVEPIPVTGGVNEKEISQQSLNNFLDEFPDLAHIEHTDVVALGPAVDVICENAKDGNADLIVMGTSGANGVEGFFIGTNSERVSRKAHCPVLVIPDKIALYKIETVGLALDTNTLENNITLDVLMQLLTAFEAKLRIVHISEKGETAFKKEHLLAQYKKSFDSIKHSFHVFYNKNPEEGISEFLTENSVDLLVLLHREHSFYERLFQSGTREKMVFRSDIPLLILK